MANMAFSYRALPGVENSCGRSRGGKPPARPERRGPPPRRIVTASTATETAPGRRTPHPPWQHRRGGRHVRRHHLQLHARSHQGDGTPWHETLEVLAQVQSAGLSQISLSIILYESNEGLGNFPVHRNFRQPNYRWGRMDGCRLLAAQLGGEISKTLHNRLRLHRLVEVQQWQILSRDLASELDLPGHPEGPVGARWVRCPRQCLGAPIPCQFKKRTLRTPLAHTLTLALPT